MNILAAILFVSAAINIAIAGYVFWRRHTLPSHFAFAVLAMVFACWTSSNLMIAISEHKQAILGWGTLAFVLATLIGLAYVIFSWCFPETYHVPPPPKSVIVAVVLVTLVLIGICFTELVQKDAVRRDGGWQLVTGPLHWLFMVYMLTMFGWGTLNLMWSRSKAPDGRERMQLNYTLTGFVLAFPIGYLTNFVVPLVAPAANVILIGGVSPAIWSLFTFYAIIRYRLLDIGIPLRATAIHGIVAVSLALFFLVPMVILPSFVGLEGTLRVVVVIVVAVVFALIVQPLHDWAKRVVDQRLFGGRYDYEGAVVRFGDRLSYNYDRPDIARVVAEELPILFRSSLCAVYLTEAAGEGLRKEVAHVSKGDKGDGFPELLKPDMPVVRALMQMRRLIHADALERLPPKWRNQRAVIEANLHDLGALVAVPILSKTVIHGIVFLGERINDNIYTKDELALARTLVGHAALALDNAALFEEQLAAKRHYETILRHMQRGLLSVHSDMRIRTLNLRGSQILGLTADEWLGRPVAELHSRFEGLLATTMREQASLPAQEVPLDIRGRGQFPCECETSLLRDGKGAVSGAAVVFQDLTEQKQFEEEVRRVDRLASVGTLAGGLAHEIKNPLVAIQTFTQLLPERFDEPEFRDQFTAVVGNEIGRINNLVHNMLDLARPRNEIPAEVQLHDVLDQIVALLHNQFVKHNITLHQHRAAHMPPVCCSEQQMHQVFLNLLQNGLEAMADQGGGELTVSTIFENGGNRDNGTMRDACVQVIVQDTGCGMSKEQIQRIFDPFYSTKANGSGLGLSNCLSILKEQGATVAVDSTSDVGSVFTLVIPLIPPSLPETEIEGNHPSS